MRIVILLVLIFSAMATSPAYAYIDPGSGSAIMSVIIGFFIAAGLAIKTYWYKLKSLFSGRKKSEGATQEDKSQGDD